MAFTMLVYSNKPEERILNINGRMMREGQEVAPGLRLEEINQDGAVFSFRGTRFPQGDVLVRTGVPGSSRSDTPTRP